MNASLIRRASAAAISPQAAAAAQELLGPLVLYRRILRSHRSLPKEMRILGDDYVKAEFRRCRTIENPLHLIGFLSQWKLYWENLQEGGGVQSAGPRGKELGEMIEKLNAEQLGQLYELMTEARKVWKPVTDAEQLAPNATQAPLPDDTGEPKK